MKHWGGPARSGVTHVRIQGNWSITMPPRRFSGVRDNHFAAFEQAARPYTMLHQTIVTPPYWSVTASPPGKKLLQRYGNETIGYEVAAGWPFLALHGAVVGQPPHNPTRIWAIELPLRSAYTEPGMMIRNGRILPLRPIFPGFLLNLIFWTGICMSIRTVARTARSRRRSARGQCQNLTCGYPLADLPMCPECGTPASVSTSSKIVDDR